MDSCGTLGDAKLLLSYGVDTVYSNKVIAALLEPPQWVPGKKRR